MHVVVTRSFVGGFSYHTVWDNMCVGESHNLVDVRRVFLPMLGVGEIVHYNSAIATMHYCL